MNWNKVKIKTQCEEFVETQTSVITSASRSTNIPAFYFNWELHKQNSNNATIKDKWKNILNK
jgi:hypothetical protein